MFSSWLKSNFFYGRQNYTVFLVQRLISIQAVKLQKVLHLQAHWENLKIFQIWVPSIHGFVHSCYPVNSFWLGFSNKAGAMPLLCYVARIYGLAVSTVSICMLVWLIEWKARSTPIERGMRYRRAKEMPQEIKYRISQFEKNIQLNQENFFYHQIHVFILLPCILIK